MCVQFEGVNAKHGPRKCCAWSQEGFKGCEGDGKHLTKAKVSAAQSRNKTRKEL